MAEPNQIEPNQVEPKQTIEKQPDSRTSSRGRHINVPKKYGDYVSK